MAYATAPRRQSLPGLMAAGAVQIMFAWLVVMGFAAHHSSSTTAIEPNLATFTVRKPEPPARPPPPKAEARGKSARSAPKAPAAAALLPKVVLREPSSATKGTISGSSVLNGESTMPGSGSGAGGVGNGIGAGGSGSGTGMSTRAVRIAGSLGDRDYPRDAAAEGAAGTVVISFRVRSDGAVDNCQVVWSSGFVILDNLTCNLVKRRFRYRPALDASGSPTDTTLQTDFTWGMRRRD